MTDPDPNAADNAAPGRWLAIVGIGEDGLEGLNPTAIRLIEGAEVVFGGRRHLALAATAIRGEAHPWPTPFDIDDVLVLRGQPVVVLASGDPFHYGVGPLLSQAIPSDEMVVIPAPSSFSLAAARLGWPLAETVQISLHGRPIDLIRPHLQPGAAILALTSDGEAPAGIAALLSEAGFGPSRIAVLEALGGPDEQIRSASAEAFDLTDIDPLNTLAILVVPGPGARIVPLVPGLPDAMYAHDGQITKQPIRAMTLAALSPRRGERLWDIGAGSGSIAIEWMLADRSLRAIAIEADAERAERIAHNAAVLGVPDLLILHGHAPRALEGLDTPDAVFLGCGAVDSDLVDAALAALRPGGRLVVNAVTLASEAALLALHAVLGGTLTRIAITHAETLGGGKGMAAGNADHAMGLDQAVTVHFIGAGPGAADLITVRGRDLIARCPVCLYAGSIVPAEMLAWCPPGAEIVDTAPLSLDAIEAAFVAAHDAGRDVARLHSGDLSVFSAVAEQVRRLERRGIPWTMTPGVPAFAAAAALIGRELTVPEVAQSVVLTRVSGRASAMPDGESLAAFAATGATLAIHLAIHALDRVVAELVPVLGADCPVAIVVRATWPEERVIRGTLGDISEKLAAAPVERTAMILVGRALGAEDFRESALYDPDYQRRFRGR